MERAVKLLKGLMLLAIIGAVFFLVCRYADRNEKEVLPEGITAVNGRLEVKRIDLASLYAGRIDELLADRGDHVARNQVIARISSAQTEAQLKAAKAQHERAGTVAETEPADLNRFQQHHGFERSRSDTNGTAGWRARCFQALQQKEGHHCHRPSSCGAQRAGIVSLRDADRALFRLCDHAGMRSIGSECEYRRT